MTEDPRLVFGSPEAQAEAQRVKRLAILEECEVVGCPRCGGRGYIVTLGGISLNGRSMTRYSSMGTCPACEGKRELYFHPDSDEHYTSEGVRVVEVEP